MKTVLLILSLFTAASSSAETAETCVEKIALADQVLADKIEAFPPAMVSVNGAVQGCKEELTPSELEMFAHLEQYCSKVSLQNRFGILSQVACELDGIRFLLSTRTAKADWTN